MVCVWDVGALSVCFVIAMCVRYVRAIYVWDVGALSVCCVSALCFYMTEKFICLFWFCCFWVKKMENPTLSGSDSGAGTAQSPSVPQLDPIFSYGVESGDIYIYVFKTSVSLVMTVAYDDTSSEEVWSAGVVKSLGDVIGILKVAEIDFPDSERENPFEMLAKDAEALRKLYHTISQLLKGE